MVSCAVARCKNSSVKTTKYKDGISFHKFPQDERRRKAWEIAVSREPEWTSTYSSAVCSEHFEIKDFYLTESGLRRLSLDAVPSVNISPCEEQKSTKLDKPKYIKPTDSPEVIFLKNKVHRLEVLAKNRKNQIKHMWLAKKRMQSKIIHMKTIIRHLIKAKDKGET